MRKEGKRGKNKRQRKVFCKLSFVFQRPEVKIYFHYDERHIERIEADVERVEDLVGAKGVNEKSAESRETPEIVFGEFVKETETQKRFRKAYETQITYAREYPAQRKDVEDEVLQKKALPAEAVVVPDLFYVPGPDLGDDENFVLGQAVAEKESEPEIQKESRGRQKDNGGAVFVKERQDLFPQGHFYAFLFLKIK